MKQFIDQIESLIRRSISEEQEAISAYLERKVFCDEVVNRVTDPILSEKLERLSYILNDIALEEKVHVGELREMLIYFGISNEQEIEGATEASEKVNETFVSIAHKLKNYVEKGEN